MNVIADSLRKTQWSAQSIHREGGKLLVFASGIEADSTVTFDANIEHNWLTTDLAVFRV